MLRLNSFRRDGRGICQVAMLGLLGAVLFGAQSGSAIPRAQSGTIPQPLASTSPHAPTLALLAEAVNFNSRVLYSQEPIDDIDDHILVNHAFREGMNAATDYEFYVNHHTMFVLYPPATNPLGGPLACDISWATGLQPSGPLL